MQLEFDIEPIDANMRLKYLMQQIDELKESMRKQTKKLFGDLRTLEKRCAKLESENMRLKLEKEPDKIEWIFMQDDLLVRVK